MVQLAQRAFHFRATRIWSPHLDSLSPFLPLTDGRRYAASVAQTYSGRDAHFAKQI